MPPTKTLEPTDILNREPDIQWVDLPGDKLLVRHAGGVTVLRGITRQDAETVLAEVDGTRSAEEVVAALAGRYETRHAVGLLRRLFGEVLYPLPPALTGRVLIAADSRSGDDLASALTRQGIHEITRSTWLLSSQDLTNFDLVLALGEGVSYRALFDLQSRCLAADVPSLFVTRDGDGIRVGPTVVPGVSPCLACAQSAHLEVLGLPEGDLLASLAEMTTLPTETGLPTSVSRSVATEAWRLLASGGEPALLTRVLRVTPSGRAFSSVLPRQTCPLHCTQASGHGDGGTGERFRVRVATELLETLDRQSHPHRRGLETPRSGDAEALVSSVGILGGGTAGYLTALALRRKLPDLRITLIESSAVPVIGVGEATTPLMPQFLHADLGLDIHQLFREVEPTFKLGIRFAWGPEAGADFNYPFGAVRPLESLLYDGHLRGCSLQSMMMTRGRVPVWEGSQPGSGLGTEVAYHLDNAKFVGYLARQAKGAGVHHLDTTIVDVATRDDGETVTALITDAGRRLEFDLYIDCSGFRSLLMEKALKSPFVSFADSLFTDHAWVGTVAQGKSVSVQPYTTAKAMSSGWCWSTPQAGEDHRGYVFCSAFQSPDDALAEMRRHVSGLGEPRLVKFRAGRHAHFWKGNVVALGNAYGFVEPLESTALHMLIRQIGILVRAFPLRRRQPGLEGLLNRQVHGTWDYLRWFLSLHYKFNRAWTTPFWRACHDQIDVSSHGELLEMFRHRGPLSHDPVARQAFDYPDPLWGAEGIDVILMGQGVPGRLPRPAISRPAWARLLELSDQVLRRSMPQRQALELLGRSPEPLDRMMSAFRAAGPAFPVNGL